jgi:hypothetical protein
MLHNIMYSSVTAEDGETNVRRMDTVSLKPFSKAQFFTAPIFKKHTTVKILWSYLLSPILCKKKKNENTECEQNLIYALKERKTFTTPIFMKIKIFQRRCTEIVYRITVELGYDFSKGTEYFVSHKLVFF